jgi:tetratricopeptide (TPR) repeat protein
VKGAILLLAAVWPAPALAWQPATIDDALHSLYNFDFPAAHATLNTYIAAHPQDPLPYAFRGSAYLFYELDRLGVLESEFLTDDDRLVEKTRPHPDPVVRAQFLQAMGDAQKRAEAVLKSNPNDRDGLFAMCVIAGVSTDYMALVEKRPIASLGPARRANGYAQRLLKLDPKFYDAYLTAGFSEYMVGSLPFFIRWFVHFDNVDGDKQRGVQHLELVAREGHYLGPLAKVFLGIIDLREKKPQEARELLAELVRDYPRNPLYRKELDKLDRKLAVPAD